MTPPQTPASKAPPASFTSSASLADPASLPLPPFPVNAFEPAPPQPSGVRAAVGIVLALVSAFVGCAWLLLVLLLLALQSASGAGWDQDWTVLCAVGVVIALSLLGGIGTAATSGRPMRDPWVRVWMSMSGAFGGLTGAVVVTILVSIHAWGL